MAVSGIDTDTSSASLQQQVPNNLNVSASTRPHQRCVASIISRVDDCILVFLFLQQLSHLINIPTHGGFKNKKLRRTHDGVHGGIMMALQ
jgi:hypothetical protein